jgi:hypothetical protein
MMMGACRSFYKKSDVDIEREKKKETSYMVDKRLLIHYHISNARLS